MDQRRDKLTQTLENEGFTQEQAQEASGKLVTLAKLVVADAHESAAEQASAEVSQSAELIRLLGARLAQASTLKDAAASLDAMGERGHEAALAQEVLDALNERPTTARALARVVMLTAGALGIDCEELGLADASWTWNAVLVDDTWLHVDVAAAVRAHQAATQDGQLPAAATALYQEGDAPSADEACAAWLLVSDGQLLEADPQREQAIVAFREAHAPEGQSPEPAAAPEATEPAVDDAASDQEGTVQQEAAPQDAVPAVDGDGEPDEVASQGAAPAAADEAEPRETPMQEGSSKVPEEAQDDPYAARRGSALPVTHDVVAWAETTDAPASDEPAGMPEGEEPSGAALPSEEAGVTAAQAQNYSYSVRPLLAPLNNIIYVATQNPDPTSFRLVDRSTHYDTSDTTDPGVFKLLDYHFIDVKYEKESTYRVAGGYLFYDYSCCSDGGSLTLQVKGSNGEFANTSKTVACTTMKDSVDYLIDTYAAGASDLFDKLDAVQSGLESIAVYPSATVDSSKRSSLTPYPLLATSPYAELALNDHYASMYEDVEIYQLLGSLYPYVLDSLSFPGMMARVASRLNPSCTIDGGDYHWEISVSYDGTTKTYGGAGTGGRDPVLSEWVRTSFIFDGSANDYGTKATLSKLRDLYLGYARMATDNIAELSDQLTGEAYSQAIGTGSWIKVQQEGWNFGENTVFSYVTKDGYGNPQVASDAWVDGHYVDAWETQVPGATFSEHSTADIIRRNVWYEDVEGTWHNSDLMYTYDGSTSTWRAEEYYYRDYWRDPDSTLPSTFILTQDQVRAMKPDANTNEALTSWLIYDGTQPPGTPHDIVHVRSVSLPKTASVCVGGEYQLVPTITPADADYTSCIWKSSNESVLEILDDGYLEGKKQGKVTVTCTTVDGGYRASCTVTVTKAADDLYIRGMVVPLGQRRKLSYTVTPSGASRSFSSIVTDDESIAVVDNAGMVTAVGYGDTYVYARTSNGIEASAMICVVPPWKRIAGQTAVGTGKAIVETDGVFKAGRGGTVIVATSDGYRDALAATGLAGRLDAPIVITPGKELAADTRKVIERLEPEQILVAGGPVAISDAVLDELWELAPDVRRVYGRNAVGTAIALYREGEGAWSDTAVVATANGFADALSIAPYAYAHGAPVFLTNVSAKSSGRVLSADALAAIEEGGFKRVIIVGGTVAVDGSVEAALKSHGVQTIKRLKGNNALGTSAAIARWELSSEGMKATHFTVATSGSYKDALCGAALCGKQNSVLVLVDKRGNLDAVEAVLGDRSAWKGIQCGYVLGGKVAVSQGVWECLAEEAWLYS